MPDGDSSRPEAGLADRVVRSMLERDAFSRWLGIEVTRVAPGEAAVRMTVRDEMLNGFGVCHGGIAFSLADSALAFAANTHGRVSLSVEAGIAYHEKISSGDVLTAEAKEEARGERIATYSVRVVTERGSRVATFRGTVYRTSRDFSFPRGYSNRRK